MSRNRLDKEFALNAIQRANIPNHVKNALVENLPEGQKSVGQWIYALVAIWEEHPDVFAEHLEKVNHMLVLGLVEQMLDEENIDEESKSTIMVELYNTNTALIGQYDLFHVGNAYDFAYDSLSMVKSQFDSESERANQDDFENLSDWFSDLAHAVDMARNELRDYF